MSIQRAHGYVGPARSAAALARQCRDIRSAARDSDMELRVVLIEDGTGRAFGRLISDLAENDLVFIPTRSDLDIEQLARVRQLAAVRTATEPVHRLERQRSAGRRAR